VEPLNAVNHAAHVVGFHSQPKLDHGGFQIRNRQVLLDNDARRQPFERPSDLVRVNDGGIGQS